MLTLFSWPWGLAWALKASPGCRVWVEVLEAPGGRVIVFHVEERPVVLAVTFQKSPVVSITAIEDRLRERALAINANQPRISEWLARIER